MRDREEHKLHDQANTIRQDIIRMIHQAGSGHPGGSLGMADVFTYLYADVLDHDPDEPENAGRDYLFLSNGHICPVLYATLARHGYFDVDELDTLREYGSRLQGHPHNTALPGIENSGGPLGQGISQAAGAAWALQHDDKDNTVYCVTGDGELNEGQVWEEALFANKHELTNLVQIVDRNHIQIDSDTDCVNPLEPLRDKYQSFGHAVFTVDGHDYNDMESTFAKAHGVEKPVVIIAETTPGKGVSYMEGNYEWHGKAPDDAQAQKALKELRS